MIRPGEPGDAAAVAQIWRDGWRDGHLGHVRHELARIRTNASFSTRAADFVMVVGDEVERSSCPAAAT